MKGIYGNFLLDKVSLSNIRKMCLKGLWENTKGVAALTIIAFHDGILLQWSKNREKIDGEAYVNTFKKIMFNGLMI
jgi:hypothetical protein